MTWSGQPRKLLTCSGLSQKQWKGSWPRDVLNLLQPWLGALPDPRSEMPNRDDITQEMLAEHWAHQVRKLVQAGVRKEAIASSLRTAEAESDWFVSVLEDIHQLQDGGAEGQGESLPRPTADHG